MTQELVCAVDLGSNSFRLIVGRVVGDQIYPLDNLKESVRLAAGLGPDKMLDLAAQTRALTALRRFNERLRGFAPEAVRAVATNALRVAKNAAEFLVQAEEALGFPIEVIAGREEARLIYVGVAHTLPDPDLQQLVVDIGGGSTEFIIGRSFDPLHLESLYMGCVSYSLRFFPDGLVDRSNLREAELAARQQLQAIAGAYRNTGWDQAVGSSGSAKAICDVLELNGLSPSGITRDGLERLRSMMLKAGSVERLDLDGLKSDRIPVFAGGVAILSAVFKEFELEHMVFSDGALRLGVLYDLLGRYHRHDLRDATVEAFIKRYQVDRKQLRRVADTALQLLAQLHPDCADGENVDRRFLEWAAMLHEIGLSVAHASYHKHTAYILANADMPGFSRMDQARLALLALAHRGKLERAQSIDPDSLDWDLILCLRLAVLLHRARDEHQQGAVRLDRDKRGGLLIMAAAEWLRSMPLTAAALQEEEQQWARLGRSVRLKLVRQSSATEVG
ncbi:exopolyphosphatase [Uliginosibacterium sediminicola]|uniref:Exopolyphosphatase n=1 Tax=Uliginosibacterium sediminicola TaxID=2024550 RepID=A0ABU9YVU3_9RHOO